MAIISLPHPKGSSHRLTRSPDGTIGKDEVSKLVQALDTKNFWTQSEYGYGSIPTNTIFRGMNIHLPAILM